ncbi:hypothetical protein [Brevundimonas denitrificans]|uniref:hypothetical protein n=1 Tax=Brevundimonas denitrificans TaxID=1443434 RepID=UPI00352E55AF
MVELASLMVRRSRETSQRAADPSVFGFVSAREKPIREFVERSATRSAIWASPPASSTPRPSTPPPNGCP